MDVDHGYHGERVRFYDEQMADADRDDAGFYADRARAADGPALELACGTGRVYLELLRAASTASTRPPTRSRSSERRRPGKDSTRPCGRPT